MHAPDGFLTAGTALAMGGLSIGVMGAALRKTGAEMSDRQIPLAGVTAAFVFAGQMVNFPVAAGTSGHLIGGALAAILLGPWMGALVVGVVVVVQALVFADGGLTALGYNVVNMAIVPAFGGYGVYLLARRVFPRSAAGVVGASAVAAAGSVVLAAIAFSLQWLFGASVPVAFDTVFGAMVGVHALIGIGEAAITAFALSAVLASRPDLVFGARDLDRAQLSDRSPVSTRIFLIGAVGMSLITAVVISQFAVDDPDGLERVAIDEGFEESASDLALDSSFFADYATEGVDNETLSLAVAGVSGTALTLVVGLGLFASLRPAVVRRRV